MNLELNLTPYAKVNSKRITALNVKCQTMKLSLKKKTGANLQDLGVNEEFLDLTPKT